MNERKYVMTKVKEGDYLLPSNDAKTVWRLNRYDDPDFVGQTHGWQAHKISAARLQLLMDRIGFTDPWDWDNWEYWGGGYRTRREAIDEVLLG